MSKLVPFEFESKQIRVVLDEHGSPWWVAKDVCRILEMKNGRDTLAKALDNEEKGVERIYTLGGFQNMTTINESGLYTLILRSNKTQAKKFRKWITSEVLPKIRKTGRYATPGTGKSKNLSIMQVTKTFLAARLIADEIGLVGKTAIWAANKATFNLHKVDVLGLMEINLDDLADVVGDEIPQKSLFPENDRLAIYHFENHKIRVLKDKSRSPWWVLTDIGKALDYNGIRAIVHRDFSRHTTKEPILTRNNLLIPMTVIDTPGLMEVLQRSVKVKSDSFLDWMTNILNLSPENNPAAAKLAPFRK